MKTMPQELERFRNVITYDETLGRTSHTAFRVVFFIFFIVCTFSLVLSAQYHNGEYEPALLGSALIFFALWLEQVLLYWYHNSFYYRGFDSFIKSANKSSQGITYEVAQLLLTHTSDSTSGFCLSPLGSEILIRCNLSSTDVHQYLSSNRIFIAATSIPLNESTVTHVHDIGSYLYTHDQSFITFLNKEGVRQDTFFGAMRFVLMRHTQNKRLTRWWSRDQLSLHSGLGRSLSTGYAYDLDQFTHEVVSTAHENRHYTPAELQRIQQMEQILAKDSASNIMMIAEDESLAFALLTALAHRVTHGTGLNALSGLSFCVLDTERIITAYPEKHELEGALSQVLDQAVIASSYVIIIPRLREAINACALMNVSLPNILEVYLAHPTIHCIGIDTSHNYHQGLQPHANLMRRFEEIVIEGTSIIDTITILQPLVIRQENRRGVLFTYDAIVALTHGAERYITSGVMPEKAIDLIHDIAQAAQTQGTVLVNVPFVQSFISSKTGIPSGPITPEEKDQLLHLEQILSTRIVGQPEAVKAIARTMRRARVDIERNDKPIGSFLFLGPTGVGKTETAKALAHTFFGDEQRMVRFDMSEFSAPHTLGYLIGDRNGTGMLTDKLQEHPYCLVLLDEFEKAHKSIHDLFLQILDEGYFTSTQGTHVNVRNTIIIATSNAASNLISRTSAIRTEVPHLDADVLNHIIETGIFKPELINRFDSTVIFEPLTKISLLHIAQLQISDLIKRVENRGYNVRVTNELLQALVEKCFAVNANGRELNRIIQDLLEEKIAKKIIAGETQVGGYLHLSVTDFSPTELTAHE